MSKKVSARLNRGGLSYSLRRYYVDDFHFRYIATLPATTTVLVLGGYRGVGRGQFRLDSYPLRAVCLNLVMRYPSDVQADAHYIPFRSQCFDAVICSELLEHVSDPQKVLSEAHRVLKTSGRLFICVPFLHQIHEDPSDYGRYTDIYWREKLAGLGFEIIAFEQQGAVWSVLIDLLRAYIYEQLSGDNLSKRLSHALAMFSFFIWGKRLAVRLDSRAAVSERRLSAFTTGFGIVAEKR